tara:strand:- start:15357 stop:16205 length:849 start_codon:yes stop_codon:yes gene_type:complete
MNNNEDFLYIEDCKNDIYSLIKNINDKCTNLEDLYKEYLQEVLKHDTHLMSLDVLFFQIELTYEDIKNYTSLFNEFLSRMYGMYYKLYIKIIHSLKDIKLDNIFGNNLFFKPTPFDDLNKREYNFEETEKIHNTIINIMSSITQYISKQKYSIEDDEVYSKTHKGININQLVFEKTHDNEILLQKTKLFNNILENYYEYQKKFLKRMILKLKVLQFQINSDIEFQTTKRESKNSVNMEVNNSVRDEEFQISVLDGLNLSTENTVDKKNICKRFILNLNKCCI